MTLLVVERVTHGTRGLLTRWMLEVHPGVFLGTLSSRVRQTLWEQLVNGRRRPLTSALLMAYRSPGEQGFEVVPAGKGSRSVFDYDGLRLLGRELAKTTPPPRRGRDPME